MDEVKHISWFPDRTEPLVEASVLRLDMADNTQVAVSADTDVSEMSEFVQALKTVLFPQGTRTQLERRVVDTVCYKKKSTNDARIVYVNHRSANWSRFGTSRQVHS